MPRRILFYNVKIESLYGSVCRLIPAYFKPHSHVEPGKLTQYRGLIPNSLTDTFINFSNTHASESTSFYKYFSVSSSPFLILSLLIISIVLSISSSSGHLFFNLLKK